MTVMHEKCYVCGQISDFEIADGSVLFREAVCPHCGSSIRHSDVAQIISDNFSTGEPLINAVLGMQNIRILDTTPFGKTYELLSNLPGCVGCEYFPDLKSGERAENGMLCVDLTRIPFPQDTFDLVITEEVLEHISDLEQALSEISRVLKPGGVHIFTIPICETISTRSVSDLNVTHPAAINGDSKVFHEFGLDIANILVKYGFSTQYRMIHRFCPPDQTTDLRKNYTAYCESQKYPLEFFHYNSIVFISEKATQMSTAIERVDLQTTENLEVVMEHIHRYRAVQDLVRGKTVLDAACGSGYGTKLLSETAKKVVGIDIDAEVIERLRREETQVVSFRCMSIEKMDFADSSFDAVVSFETIEHVNEDTQKTFLAEIQRVLKPGGLLVVSTPNVDVLKTIYRDYYNPFHVKEYTRDEFYALLKQYFKYIQEYYQNVMEASCISSTVESVLSNPINAENGKYLIAVCSNYALPENLLHSSFFPSAEVYYHELHRSITGKANLYIDAGFGFREEDVITGECNYQKGYFHIVFDTSKYHYIQAMRFDPLEGSFCRVQVNSCYVDGIQCPVEALNAAENYEAFDYFFHNDPQYLIRIPNKRATNVELEGYLDYRIFKRVSQIYCLLQDHRTRIANIECAFQSIQQQLSGKEKRIDELSTILSKKDKQIGELSVILSQKEAENDQNIKRLEQLNREKDKNYANEINAARQRYTILENEKSSIQQTLMERDKLLNGILNSFSFKLTRPLYNIKSSIYFAMEKHDFTRRIRKAVSIWRHEGYREMIRKWREYRTGKKYLNQVRLENPNNEATAFRMYDAEYQANRAFTNCRTDVKALAFYLPQFHTFPENDAWWGEGFTEWTNVKKGMPRFQGHYQPRTPHQDTGYYCLEDINVMRHQAELAKSHGIYGFCFYYYWFSGKRLMEKPVDLLLQHPEIDIPFCLCWANENWTRRWDGQEQDVLIKQEYSDKDDDIFIRDLKRYLDDPRYIRVNGKPVIIVYSPCFIPDCRKSFQRWRETAKEIGVGEIEIWICLTWGRTAESMQIVDCVDAEVEFPPHNLGGDWLEISNIQREDKDTIIYDYARAVDFITDVWERTTVSPLPIHYSCMLAWDNAARRKDGWHAFYHFSLWSFYHWLSEAVRHARDRLPEESRFIFINAWNEWGEGTYLEPDEKYGYASINTAAKALYDLPFDLDTQVIDESFPTMEKGTFQRKEDTPRIAVQAHIFHVDLMESIVEQLNHIPYLFDLFVTTDTEEKKTAILDLLAKNCVCRKVMVQVYPNRGRDVGPFLMQMSSEIDHYDYIGHFHTKRTVNTNYGDRWREYLFHNLLGDPQYIERLFYLFESDKRLGIIMPELYPPIREQAAWTGEYAGVKALLDRIGFQGALPEQMTFPAGNMFWARTAAVRPLFSLGLKETDFPEEAGQRYATLAHQVERSWIYIAEMAGYGYRTVLNGYSL